MINNKKRHNEISWFLVRFAFVVSLLSELIKINLLTSLAQESSLSMFSGDQVMPMEWSITAGLSFFVFMLSSLYFFVKFFKSIDGKAILALSGLMLWVLIVYLPEFWSGFGLYEFIYFKGPATWMSCFVFVLGLISVSWEKVASFFNKIFFAVLLLLLYQMLTSNGIDDRSQILKQIGGALFLFQYVFLHYYLNSFNGRDSFLSNFGLLVFMVSSLMTATRSMILTGVLYSIVKNWIREIYLGKKTIFYFLKKMAIFLVVFVFGFVLIYFSGYLDNSIGQFLDRIDEDTRSDQYVEFFEQINLFQLLVGYGSRATWVWQGVNYSSIDGSYILTLFIGGIPLLGFYCYLLLSGPLNVVKNKSRFELPYISAAYVCLFWALAMTGFGIYAVPEAKFFHYLIFFLSGRCYFAKNNSTH